MVRMMKILEERNFFFDLRLCLTDRNQNYIVFYGFGVHL